MKFYTKKGKLTSYGLACGYIEQEKNNGISTVLWAECNIYHVRQHNHNTGNRIFWHSFHLLNDARQCFKQAV